MEQMKKKLEGKIDFQGQRLADRIGQEMIVMGALLSLLLGFAFDSLSVTMYLYGVIVLVACALVIPPWPFYNQHKTQWLPNRPESSPDEVTDTDATGSAAVIDEGAEGSKKKKA
ncbi:SPC12-domain-containing protein [Microstroma glucosiphilum]|uniref:Signal peptidase complex subunit 1 n=1 Tax=Pseudomicrostroma glucosiphilum TaxID=1684307 RepID=A0A316U6W2_9BASI|nr:SPC12-domain-containing protein [Pseudomicrostroma glucosiphilum]PWN21017.1 SPC12-domain-containing protein [Pseudomicrostroma glucosiphilum]